MQKGQYPQGVCAVCAYTVKPPIWIPWSDGAQSINKLLVFICVVKFMFSEFQKCWLIRKGVPVQIRTLYLRLGSCFSYLFNVFGVFKDKQHPTV